MSFKQQDAKLMLRSFKQRIQEMVNLELNIGIPKEVEINNLPESRYLEAQKKSRHERELMADLFLNTSVMKNKMKNEEEIYVADIAYKNNFGSLTEHIPARPFGSTLITRYKDKIIKVMQKEYNFYLEGKQSLEKAYNRVGIICAGYMKDNLKNGNWKANAPLTVFLKGSSKPLIDTGQMWQSITYVVKKREE